MRPRDQARGADRGPARRAPRFVVEQQKGRDLENPGTASRVDRRNGAVDTKPDAALPPLVDPAAEPGLCDGPG